MKVYCTSPWIPVEWVCAHGHEPCGVWAAVDELPSATAEGVCPFARALVELASKNHQAAFVFTTACDQSRRAADAVLLQSHTPVFLFNLPATWQTPAAHRLYRAELARLGRFLERLGGFSPSYLELMLVIRRYSEQRAMLLDLIQHSPARQAAEAVMQYFWPDHAKKPASAGKVTAHGVPVALIGGPLLPSQWGIFDVIESAGGRVVLNATEPGERCLVPQLTLSTDNSDLQAVLADHYLDHCVDVFQRPNTRLYDWLAVRIAQRGVRAILLWVNLHCDLWRAEAQTLRNRFGLPVVMLEAHDIPANLNRVTTRLAALIETVRSGSRPADLHQPRKSEPYAVQRTNPGDSP